MCHVTCLGDHETYSCVETQQLRLEANIDAALTLHYDAAHATDREDNPTTADHPIIPLDDDNDVNVDDERQAYIEMEKEELVTHTLTS